VKVAVTGVRGELVASAVERYPLHLLGGGGVEQDPADWWDAVVRATRRVLGEPGVDPARVVGVGCSAQWSGTVPVDDRGQPLMRAVIWMDSRGATQVRRITRGVPAVQGYGVGRLAAWVRRSGGAPAHSGKDTVAHILWIRDRLPDVYRRTRTFLEPRDWLNFQLSGRMASSPDAATML
jgi:xylulokinase